MFGVMTRKALVVAVLFAMCVGKVASGQTPRHGALLVVTKQTHALTIVDGETLKVLGQVPIGEDPHEVVVAPDNRTAFVSNYGEGLCRRWRVLTWWPGSRLRRWIFRRLWALMGFTLRAIRSGSLPKAPNP